MSSYEAKDSRTRAQQLKVQELCVAGSDTELYTEDAGDVIVKVGEEVTKVVLAVQKDDSANTSIHYAAASLTICNSQTPYAAGGDKKAVRVATSTLADPNDVLTLKYETKQ